MVGSERRMSCSRLRRISPNPGRPSVGFPNPHGLGILSRFRVRRSVLRIAPGGGGNSSERMPEGMQAEPMAGTCWSTPPQPSRLYNRVEKPRCFRQRPRTGRAFGGLGLCSAVPVTCRQPLGDGETASQVRAEFTPYLYRGRANHLHMGKRRVRRRGGRLPARGRGSDPSLTAPRQPPHRLSFHKTNFKVNKAPGTRPLQPLYHRSGVFFLPPPPPHHHHHLPLPFS